LPRTARRGGRGHRCRGCVVGGDAGTEERGGVNIIEAIGNECESVGWSDDVVGIAAVEGNSGDLAVFAEDEIAAAAGRTVITVAAVPTEAYALAWLEERHIGADRIDDAGDLMAGNARILDAGPITELGQRIAVADAAGLNPNANVAGAGIGKFSCDELKRSAGGGNLDGTACNWGHTGILLVV
jgi:hypothetical protein